jgi:hypothetical protein
MANIAIPNILNVFIEFVLFCSLNSQKKADKKEGVGTYCFTQLMRLLALPLEWIKTIAHTKGYVKAIKDCTNH